MTTPNLSVVFNINNLKVDASAAYSVAFPADLSLTSSSVVAISSAVVPYSWYNISSAAGNNTFQFQWPSVGSTLDTVTIPDGNYSIQSLNEYIQFYCVQNGFYLVNGTTNVYYFTMTYNTTYNKVQLLFYTVPTSLPSGYTQPSNFAGYSDTTEKTPTFGLPVSNSIASIIGYAAGTTYGNASTVPVSLLSSVTPQPYPTKSVIVHCNLVDDADNNDVIASIPINTTFGDTIKYTGVQQYVPIRTGVTYTTIEVSLTDQFNQELQLTDPSVSILLSIVPSSGSGTGGADLNAIAGIVYPKW